VAAIDELFSIEALAREGELDAQQRLALRQAEAGPWLEKIKTLTLEARKTRILIFGGTTGRRLSLSALIALP
jgi:hypothetical protein